MVCLLSHSIKIYFSAVYQLDSTLTFPLGVQRDLFSSLSFVVYSNSIAIAYQEVWSINTPRGEPIKASLW